MTKLTKLAVCFLPTLFVAGALVAQQPAKKDEQKWFVMRNAHTGQCWSVLLIRIQGFYRHGAGRIAAGPFDTDVQAIKQLENLKLLGTCS